MNTRRSTRWPLAALLAAATVASPFALAQPADPPAPVPLVEHGEGWELMAMPPMKRPMVKAAFLGVSTSPATPALREQLKITTGVGLVIDFVEPGSPADKAGVKRNDLLTRVNDQWIINPQQLATVVRMNKTGDTVNLTLVREGQATTVSATLSEKEVPALDDLGHMPGMDLMRQMHMMMPPPGNPGSPGNPGRQAPGNPPPGHQHDRQGPPRSSGDGPGAVAGPALPPPAMPLVSHGSQMASAAVDGWVVVVQQRGHLVEVWNPAGEQVFRGPAITEEQVQRVPEQVRERTKALIQQPGARPMPMPPTRESPRPPTQ